MSIKIIGGNGEVTKPKKPFSLFDIPKNEDVIVDVSGSYGVSRSMSFRGISSLGPTGIFENAKPAKNLITVKTEEVTKVVKSLFDNSLTCTRVSVTIEELQAMDVNKMSPARIKRVRDMLLTINVDNINNSQVLYWGADIQKKYSELLERNFQLFQSAVITEAKGYINDIIEILTTLTVEEKKTFFGLIKKKSEFDDNYSKLKNRINHLEDTLPTLVGLRESIEESNQKETDFHSELDILILGANFLVQYLKDNPIGNLFLSRINSLLTTRTAIIGNDIQRKAFIDSISMLIESVQETLRVEIPLWYENCLAYFSIRATNDVNKKSEILQLLATQQNRIITKLKK